jgi:hypothetical protein
MEVIDSVTNTLSYYGTRFITVVKMFKIQKPYSQHFIFFLKYERPNKLECYITLGWKDLPGTNTLTNQAYL